MATAKVPLPPPHRAASASNHGRHHLQPPRPAVPRALPQDALALTRFAELDMAGWKNPLGFTPLPVIVVTSITYIALFAALLTVHLVVPDYPSSTPAGTNLT